MTSKSIGTSAMDGTSEDQIRGISFWLRQFQPQHITFVLDLERSWSKFDRNRITSITTLLTTNFNTNHTVADVFGILAFFNDPRSLPLLHTSNISSLMFQGVSTLTVEPYCIHCPICSSVLSSKNASVRPIDVYWLTGAVCTGERYHRLRSSNAIHHKSTTRPFDQCALYTRTNQHA
jgi:hypothetical protein